MQSDVYTKDKGYRNAVIALNVVGYIFLLVAACVLYSGTLKPAYKLYKISRSIPVDAVAVQVYQIEKNVYKKRSSQRHGGSYVRVPHERTTFEYIVDGQVYVHTRDVSLEENTISSIPRVSKGEIIQLYIDPNNPAEPLESFSPLWLILGVLGFLGFLYIGMFFFKFKRKLINMANDPALQKQLQDEQSSNKQ